jgi:hypothetical protein
MNLVEKYIGEAINIKWQKDWLDSESAKMLGDMRFEYIPFHKLSKSDQNKARRAYPHKAGDYGAKYAFQDEHYYYPVKRNGVLGNGRRVLAIPHKKIIDDKYMAKIGYEITPDWNV